MEGDYKIDDVNPWEEKQAMLSLQRCQPNILTLRKNLNLSKSETIKILIYSVDQQNTDDIKKHYFVLVIWLIRRILNMTYVI